MRFNIADYRDLFVHRDDVFAVQHSDGSYRPQKRALNDEDIYDHLAGHWSVGTYVIRPEDDTVKFVVFDLDTYDETALSYLKQAVYELVVDTDEHNFGTPWQHCECCMLESSGGKGYHIWLFFDGPVPAKDARYWTGVVKDEYDFRNPGDWPALEIFPKQDRVPNGGYGNLVKLPFGVHAKSGKKSEIVPGQGWANSVDKVQRLRADLIPVAPEAVRKQEGHGGVTRFPCISKIIKEGAPQGMRDNAMFHFCHYACGTGLPEDMVHEWAERVNEQFDPPLTDFEVEKSVHSAAGMESPHPSCSADWLKDFCPGGPDCCAPWNNERPTRKERVQPRSQPLTREQWLAQRRNR